MVKLLDRERTSEENTTSLLKTTAIFPPGFTIVELLIVIVVIGILAAIVIISYTGITRQAAEGVLKSDLHTGAVQLGVKQTDTGEYPNPDLPADIKPSSGNAFQYTSDGSTFCLSATSTSPGVSPFHISDGGSIEEGVCPGHSEVIIADGSIIQTITTANCPATRTRAVDARDNHTYWVQKLADGKCWMLTNLAYAGGGNNTYGDVKTLTEGTGSSATYTDARYYIPSGANVTTEPTAPSASTDGTGQYGYFYNWCAAMGAQTGTSACKSGTTPAADVNESVCPAGWRLPTGGSDSELVALNEAINGGSGSSDEGLLTVWLGQRAGEWTNSGFETEGLAYYWSSTLSSSTLAYKIYFLSYFVGMSDSHTKLFGIAVRCLAAD